MQNEYLKALAGGLPNSKLMGERIQTTESQIIHPEVSKEPKTNVQLLPSSSTSRND
jgi:hypothetical protein